MALPKVTPEPTIVPPPVDNSADVFADAFKDLTVEENAPKIAEAGTDPVVEGAVAAEAAAKPPVQIEIEGLPDPSKVGTDGKVAAEGATGAAPAEGATGEAKLSNEELLERFRTVMAEPPKPAAAAEPPAPSAQLQSKPAVSEYTPAQKQLVDDYMKEWPDVYNAEQLIRAKEYQALVAHIFAEISPYLQQLQTATGTIAQQSHIEKLQTAIPDYGEVVPKVLDWIGKQPAYLKSAYTAVAQTGDVGDVVDLVNRYRAETGTAAPAGKAPAADPPKPAPAPVPAKVIKGLAPVATKRTGVQTDMIQNDDFDGAFQAFSNVA